MTSWGCKKNQGAGNDGWLLVNFLKVGFVGCFIHMCVILNVFFLLMVLYIVKF